MSVGLKQFQEKRKLLAVSRAAGAGAIVGAAPKCGQLAHNTDGLIFAVFFRPSRNQSRSTRRPITPIRQTMPKSQGQMAEKKAPIEKDIQFTPF